MAKTTSSKSDPVTRYAEAVVELRELAGPDVREACARHIRDLETGQTRGLRWDAARRDHALNFFPKVLRLNGGHFEGLPFNLIGFQEFIIGSLFGWLNAEGYRRFRTAYVEIGKGNGKSPLAGGIGLYLTTNDREQRAEVYAAATKKDQAMILFKDAVAMVDQSPALKQRMIKTPAGANCHHLGYPAKNSFFRAIASDDGQSGPRPHGFLIDELHEHLTAVVVNMAAAGQKWRKQPLTFEITNSGFDKTTVCYQHHEYSRTAVRARPGEKGFDDEWFAFVCGLDKGDDPFKSEASWRKANPGLGVIIQPSYLRKQVREAVGMPAQASKVRRLNFCQWVDAENPWIEGHLWEQCEAEFDGLAALAACDRIVGGLDLSGSRDLTALTLAGKDSEGRTVARVEFWTPGDTVVQRSLADRVPYDEWARAGFVHLTPGRAVDYGFVAQRLVDLCALFPQFRELAFDRYRMKYLETELDALGCELSLVEHPQGGYKPKAKKDENGEEVDQLWMPHSIELLAKDVATGKLRAEKNPCLTWNNASAVLEADAQNNKIFSKRKSRGRIDGVVSLAMAEGLLNLGAKAQQDIDDFLNSPVIA